ncbi:hypothetical protein P5E79_12500 [Clostridium perfringens]|nr:hypothetical protein [Clostridium perfringens]MDK0779980.1 hypothetical protein [Clostridium perfringens]
MVISIIFMLLLILPISPAALSKESLIALIVWCIIGFIAYYKIQKDNFIFNNKVNIDTSIY